MYRMVVTDLDGTLLNNKKQVSEANVKAIQNLKDQNITFVMATGRSDVMTRAYTKQLKNVDIVIGCDVIIRRICLLWHDICFCKAPKINREEQNECYLLLNQSTLQ